MCLRGLRTAATVLAVLTVCGTLQASVRLVGLVVDASSRPVSGVEVIAVGIGRDVTATAGDFGITVSDDRVGTSVTLQARKSGWHVADPRALEITIVRDPAQHPVKIVMAPDEAVRSEGRLLRLQIENPMQVEQTVKAQPTFNGQTVFCGSLHLTLIFAYAGTKTGPPLRVNSVSVHTEQLADANALKPESCDLDPLSARPYGIAETDAFVVTSDEKGLHSKFIKDAATAFPVDPENLLRSASAVRAITLHAGEEQAAFDVLVETKSAIPQRIWFSAQYDAGGPQNISSNPILVWR